MKEYPSWRYHATEDPCIIHSAEEDAALGADWADTPAAFTAEASPEPAEDIIPVPAQVEALRRASRRRKA